MTSSLASDHPASQPMQLPPADVRYQKELVALREIDTNDKPDGWLLSPQAVVDFICGTCGIKDWCQSVREAMVITEKFVGSRDLIQRCVVTLAGERGLLLVGEPGTAKSMLELLAVAISGTSGLAIQGTAGTTEDQVDYG
ncbi:MAG: AAA family ATPase [Pirellulales bacterium]